MTENDARRRDCCAAIAIPGDNLCRASECMAWRWLPLACDAAFTEAVKTRAETTGDKAPFAKSARYVTEHRAEFGLPVKSFEGYCGLAGKP